MSRSAPSEKEQPAVAFSLLIGAEETTPNKSDEPASSVAAVIKVIGRQQRQTTAGDAPWFTLHSTQLLVSREIATFASRNGR